LECEEAIFDRPEDRDNLIELFEKNEVDPDLFPKNFYELALLQFWCRNNKMKLPTKLLM
jgi:hypothetical protein